MGYVAKSIDASSILAGLTTDSIKWKGADIILPRGQMDFWSAPTGSLGLTNTPTDKTLQNVVTPNITGLTVLKAYCLMSVGFIANSTGATNYIDGDQYIQIDESASGYINAMKIPSGAYQIKLNDMEIIGESLVGAIDISSLADFNKTLNFKWTNAAALASTLSVVHVRVGVRLVF